MGRIVILLFLGSFILAAPGDEPVRDPVVARALDYLARQQQRTGDFPLEKGDYSVAGTGLVLLAFRSAGVLPDDQQYGLAQKKAVAFLLSRQDPTGQFKEPRGSSTLYNQGIATWALAEYTVARGKDATEPLLIALNRAVKYLVGSQSDRGGWRYAPGAAEGDMSITSWQVMALRAARKAGCKVPDAVFEKAAKFVESCRKQNQGFSYIPGGAPSPACTAAGTLYLLLAGTAPDQKDMKALRDVTLKQAPSEKWAFYFYTCNAQAQVLARFEGTEASAGRKVLIQAMEKRQQDDGAIKHDDRKDLEAAFGPVYSTSVAVLALTARERKLSASKVPNVRNPGPMREIEQKFRVADLDALARRVVALGHSPDAGHSEADHYLAAPDRDFVQTGEVFRMRRIGSANYLTYKGPKKPGPFRDREELEVPLPPGDDVAEQHLKLLQFLGYRPVAVVRKKRRHASFQREGFTVTLCLDEVEEVGTYCEVEVLTEEDRAEQAKQLIGEVAAELDLTELEPTSYLGLLLAGRGQ